MSNAIATIPQGSPSDDFMPVFDIKAAIQRRNAVVEFVKAIMVEGLDYGKVPGTDKPTLLKPGSEKLITFFGLVPEFETVEQVEDWTGEKHKQEPFFYYRYRCRLSRSGRLMGEGEGSCNTHESKYRYRWVSEETARAVGFTSTAGLIKRGGTISEFDFAVEKAETGGKYGKPGDYWERCKQAIADGSAVEVQKPIGRDRKLAKAWQISAWEYRVPNPDVADQVNTCQKMAQKRALIAAVLVTTNASEFFTQDLEDMDYIDLPASAIVKPAAPATGDKPAPGEKHNGAQKEVIRRKTVADASGEPPLPPAEEHGDKPWRTKKEMLHVFEEIASECLDAGVPQIYSETLADSEVVGPADFTDGEKAFQCYMEIYSRLSEAKAAQR